MSSSEPFASPSSRKRRYGDDGNGVDFAELVNVKVLDTEQQSSADKKKSKPTTAPKYESRASKIASDIMNITNNYLDAHDRPELSKDICEKISIKIKEYVSGIDEDIPNIIRSLNREIANSDEFDLIKKEINDVKNGVAIEDKPYLFNIMFLQDIKHLKPHQLAELKSEYLKKIEVINYHMYVSNPKLKAVKFCINWLNEKYYQYNKDALEDNDN